MIEFEDRESGEVLPWWGKLLIGLGCVIGAVAMWSFVWFWLARFGVI